MAHESLAQDCRASGDRHVAVTDAEILSTPEHLAGAAVGALGWEGTVLAPAHLLGRRVVVVAELFEDVHKQRIASGWSPVTDRMSVSLWDWPEMRCRIPPAAVRLHGVLAPARHWRTGLTGVVPFAGVCATALLLPSHIARDSQCRAHAARYGPTVLAAAAPHDPHPDAVDVVQLGRSGPLATPPPDVLVRWIHELVYDRLLRQR